MNFDNGIHDEEYWDDDYYMKNKEMYFGPSKKLDWNAWGYIIILIFLIIAGL